MPADENKSDLSFNTVIPNSFNVRTTNPFSLAGAVMSPSRDPESTALLVDVDRNDIDSASDPEQESDLTGSVVHNAPSTSSQQSYVHVTSLGSALPREKRPRFGRVIKYLNWAVAVFNAVALILLLTYKIIIAVAPDFTFDTSGISHAINHLGLVLCILFVCSIINILTLPPLLCNMVIDLILTVVLSHFGWLLSEATLEPREWCEHYNYWMTCSKNKNASMGLGITVSVHTQCFAIAHLALFVMRSIVYCEGKTWKSPVRLPVGDYRLEFRVKICKDGEQNAERDA